MARRTGWAELPLHGGRAPRWLFERMARLAPAIVEAIVLDHGPAEVLRRLSDPYWFQAFGCVLGFDWHSSGVTTVVCGALKQGLAGRERDTGIHVAGGKGAASRKTPHELVGFGERLGLDGGRLAYTSRLTAKVDSAAVQDGFQIYHHTFLLTDRGEWSVIQQGMRAGDAAARRYHWLGETMRDFVDEPHAAIASSAPAGAILNLVAHEAADARAAVVEIAREHPDAVLREATRIAAALGTAGRLPATAGSAARPVRTSPAPQMSLFDGGGPDLPGSAQDQLRPAPAAPPRLLVEPGDPVTMRLPAGHAVDVRRDLDPRHLSKVLLSTYEASPTDFEQLLTLPGVGPKSIRALALMADLLYGRPASIRDPARFSFAHGGKDGHPYPVDRRTYDRSVEYLREAVARAKLGDSEKVGALRRLAEYGSG